MAPSRLRNLGKTTQNRLDFQGIQKQHMDTAMKLARAPAFSTLLTAFFFLVSIDSVAHPTIKLKSNKDATLDVGSSSFYLTEQQHKVAGRLTTFGLGTISFPQGSFSLTRQFSIDQSDFSAPVPADCPPGSFAFLPFIKFSMIWEAAGDALLLVKDSTLPNGVCLTPTGGTTHINLTVHSGTGPYRCASGNWSRIVDNALTPPELTFLTSEDVSAPEEPYLIFLPTSAGKSVSDPNQPQGTVSIPGACP
jgi:hypothetical protein